MVDHVCKVKFQDNVYFINDATRNHIIPPTRDNQHCKRCLSIWEMAKSNFETTLLLVSRAIAVRS